jgi:ferrochelatase
MTTKAPVAVVLMQFGGPDTLEAVQPFLYNILNDADIIDIPLAPIFQPIFAWLISRKRAREVKEEYAEMGGKSPIVEMTNKQSDALQQYLDAVLGPNAIRTVVAMRYWNPFTEEALKQLIASKIEDVVLLPLYAQYSRANAGSSYNEWDRVKKRLGAKFNERRVNEYKTQPKYIASLNRRIDEALERFADPSDVFFLFSAHGTPVDFVTKGDPYSHHINDTVNAIMALRKNDHKHQLAYQSKLGPKKWLEPSTTATVTALGRNGIKKMLVIPVAFVSDHIETMQELNVEERENAITNGVEQFEMTEGLNDSPLFIESLAEIALAELAQLRPDLIPPTIAL